MQIEARYARGKSLLFFCLGLLAIAVNTGLYFFGPFYYPAVWLVGAISALLGARGLDRSVKLRVGPEGLWYAPWGTQLVSWGEFEGFSVFRLGNHELLQAHPTHSEQLRSRLPLIHRLNSSVNARFGRPSFYISPAQLDVDLERLLEVISYYKPDAVQQGDEVVDE